MENGVLEKAVEIAQEAGALLANYYERRVAFESKGEFDLVTEADRASEKLIVERLRAHFPSHGDCSGRGRRTHVAFGVPWFVDPLDGTTNFAHSFPIFNVTLGLARGEEMIAGVVFDPIAERTLHGGTRRGSLSEQPAHSCFKRETAGG